MLDPNLKQRLIGAAVLIGLGIVVIPLLLPEPIERSSGGGDGSARVRYAGTTDGSVPRQERGKTQQEAIALPVSPEPARPSVAESTFPAAPVPAKEGGVDASPTKAAEETGGWLIQIGSFTQPENARRMRDEAVSAGYRAFIEPGKKGTKTIYRVKVGPERESKRAKKLKQELEHRLHVNAFLISPSES